MVNNNLVGGYHQPLNEKSESQMGLLFPIYEWKNNPNVPNHKPDNINVGYYWLIMVHNGQYNWNNVGKTMS